KPFRREMSSGRPLKRLLPGVKRTEMKKRVVLSALAACATLCATQWTASANFFPKLYVTSLSGRFASDEPLAKPGAGTVGTYNGQTGTTLDAALVLGLHGPVGIAIS